MLTAEVLSLPMLSALDAAEIKSVANSILSFKKEA
jgi:hypothetical protein